MATNSIPTLQNARPVDSHVQGLVFGHAKDVGDFAHRQLPTIEGARSGTFTVIRDETQKRKRRRHVPGTNIPAQGLVPRDPVSYEMFLGADAGLIPDLMGQAAQLGGDPQANGTSGRRAIDQEKALRAWYTARGLLCDREKAFADFITSSTWNTGSTTVLGGDSWLDVTSDIPGQLQDMKGSLNADQKLTLILSRDVWAAMERNVAIRSEMSTTANRHLATREVYQQWGIDHFIVSRATYTPNGGDYIMPDLAMLCVLEEPGTVIPNGQPLNPSAFARLVERLRLDTRFSVGSPMTFGSNEIEDFLVREGYSLEHGGQVMQFLYGEDYQIARAKMAVRYTMG